MLTTSTIPAPAGPLPAAIGAARPDDQDSVRLFLSWAAGALWPDGSDYPPLTVSELQVRYWWQEARWDYPIAPSLEWPVAYDPVPSPFGGNVTGDPAAYARHQAGYLLQRAAAAAAAVAVTPAYDRPEPEPPGDARGKIRFFLAGVPVEIGSWEALDAPGYDGAHLWAWSAADRAEPDGRRTAKDRGTVLESTWGHALTTAQTMFDALELFLDEADQYSPTLPAPTNRRPQWR